MSQHGPQFLCVGLEKSGTTWLYQTLSRHPAVWLPPFKELSYFYDARRGLAPVLWKAAWGGDWRAEQQRAYLARRAGRLWRHVRGVKAQRDLGLSWDLRYFLLPKTDRWYRGLFKEAADRISGDISPAYAGLNDAEVARVARRFPELKIVVLLRDPMDRIWSKAKMNLVKHGGHAAEALSPEAVHAVFEGAHRGVPSYTAFVDRWRGAFGRENVFVGYHDQLAEDPEALYTALCGFLGLDPDALPPGARAKLRQRFNVGLEIPMAAEHRRKLADLFRPAVEELAAQGEAPYAARWLERYAALGRDEISPAP